jgi:hypothetical protein
MVGETDRTSKERTGTVLCDSEKLLRYRRDGAGALPA